MRPGPLRALFAAAISAAAFASAAPAAAKSAARAPVPGPAVAVVWDDRGEAAAAKFSRSRAENVVSLLSRGGLEAAVFPLSRLAAAASAERRALHLVLPDAATAGDRAVLEAFVARGGGVVVHGSFSPVLAGFFGLAKPVVSYVRPSGGGACFVQPFPSAYGSACQISTDVQMSFIKNGVFYDNDRGAEPDIPLLKPASFYDREGLSAYINSLR